MYVKIRKIIRKILNEKRITLPTWLTIARILLTPVIVYAMVQQKWGIAFWGFIIASVTDALDGFLARLYDDRSLLGTCLDPIADKILLLSSFFTLAFVQSPIFSIPGWFFIVVCIKECIVLFGALALLWFKCGFEVRPTMLGKLSTVVQILFIVWVFACYFFHWLPVKTYYVMLSVMLLFIVLSCIQYVGIGIRYIRSCKKRV